jgi:hypothetical protein
MSRPPIHVRLAPAPTNTAPALTGVVRSLAIDEANPRLVRGTITEYNVPSTTQRVVFHDKALRAREPLDRVKFLLDHDNRQPIGTMIEFDGHDQAAMLVAEGEAGDAALLDIERGLRDALSVGFAATEYAFGEAGEFHVYDAELYEVSLVAIADFAGARLRTLSPTTETTPTAPPIESEHMDPIALAAALAAGSITQETHDRQLSAWNAAHPAPSAQPEQPVVPAELAAGPDVGMRQPAPAHTEARPVSLHQLTVAVAAAVNTGEPRAVQLALADILPAQDAGQAFVDRADWIGELFTARATARPWIESLGTPAQLTTMRKRGWRWKDRKPGVGPYAGNKAEVPTGTIATEFEEFVAKRFAGGWDIDRVFLDLGDPGFLASFWEAATDEYKELSDADVRTQILAKANLAANKVTNLPSVLAAMASVAGRGRRIKGATIDRFVLSNDLFDEYAALKASDVPHWLSNAVGGVDLQAGTIAAGGMTIKDDPDLPARTVVAYDHRAATYSEKSPMQVQALDVAHGGIDLGLYSYGMTEFHDSRLFLSATVAAAPAA